MADSIFNAVLMPRESGTGSLKVSIAFELNLKHPVFTVAGADAAAWKSDVAQFTRVVRAAIAKGAFSVNYDGQHTRTLTDFEAPGNDAEALRLWAGLLGYSFVGSNPVSRTKTWGAEAPRALPIKEPTSFTTIKTWPLTLNAGPQLQAANNAITSADDITGQLSGQLLNAAPQPGVAVFSDADKTGIGLAYKATQAKTSGRNKTIADIASNSYNAQPHPLTTTLKSEGKLVKEEEDQLKLLEEFYSTAQVVINEPQYIREAVQLLNQTPSIRTYLGTLITGSLDLTSLTVSQLKLVIDVNQLGVALQTDPYINTDFRTMLDPQAHTPIPIPGNYNSYWAFASPILQHKSKILSYETEAAPNSNALALQALNQNGPVQAANYDLGDYQAFQHLKPKTKVAWESYQQMVIARGLLVNAAVKANNQVANTQTKGHQLFITDPNWLQFDLGSAARPVNNGLYEHDLLAGFAVYLKVGQDDWKSISNVIEHFGLFDPEKKGDVIDLPIQTGALIHSMGTNAQTGDPQLNGLNNGFMFSFDGTQVSIVNPMRHPEENGTASEKAATLLNNFAKQKDQVDIEALVLHLYGRRWLMSNTFPGHASFPVPPPLFLLSRRYDNGKAKKVTQPKLKFTTELLYTYAMVGQLHNGYAPYGSANLQAKQLSDTVNFLRCDHIKAPVIALPFDIFQGTDADTKTPKDEYLGETSTDLVIRQGDLTKHAGRACNRYILPPEVPNFQIYLWYDVHQNETFAKSRQLDEETLYQYYLKAQQAAPKTTDTSRVIYSGYLEYLPDPVVTGFVLKFYHDRDCTLEMDHPEQYCPYTRRYPHLGAWEIILTPGYNGLEVKADPDAQTITVALQAGKQLFARVIPTYQADFACFGDSVISGTDFNNKGKGASLFYDLRYCGTTVLSFTYASQYPVVQPQVISAAITRYPGGTAQKKPASVTLDIEVVYEHLNLWNGITIPGQLPTGEIDVYLTWDEYSTKGLQQSMKDKPAFLLAGKIDFSATANQGAVYHRTMQAYGSFRTPDDPGSVKATINLELGPEFAITYFTDAALKIRNTSRFASYFKKTDLTKLSEADKESFSTWSTPVALPPPDAATIRCSALQATGNYLFNNLKPLPPVVEKIVPLVVSDAYTTGDVHYYQRVRIYFNQVPLVGKDARMAILIQDAKAIYPLYLAKARSSAGLDSVTDDPSGSLGLVSDQLTAANFNLDRHLLETEYLQDFKPAYRDDPNGLVSYTICWDQEQALWYIDTELNLKKADGTELHNPFVQLFIAAYQPFSANYNTGDDSSVGFNQDYRLSQPISLEYFSIYPSRTFSHPHLLFKTRSKSGCTLSSAINSLFIGRNTQPLTLQTEFVVALERSAIHGIWEPYPIDILTLTASVDQMPVAGLQPIKANGQNQLGILAPLSAALIQGKTNFECNFQLSYNKHFYYKYRIVVTEVDLFNDLDANGLQNVLANNGNPALVSISGVYIRGNYIFYE